MLGLLRRFPCPDALSSGVFGLCCCGAAIDIFAAYLSVATGVIVSRMAGGLSSQTLGK